MNKSNQTILYPVLGRGGTYVHGIYSSLKKAYKNAFKDINDEQYDTTVVHTMLEEEFTYENAIWTMSSFNDGEVLTKVKEYNNKKTSNLKSVFLVVGEDLSGIVFTDLNRAKEFGMQRFNDKCWEVYKYKINSEIVEKPETSWIVFDSEDISEDIYV